MGLEALGPGNPFPKTAWSPALCAGGERVTEITRGPPAAAVGFFFASKGRIAHVGLVEKWGKRSVTTIEGNTSDSKGIDREGGGVYRRERDILSIHTVKDWIGR